MDRGVRADAISRRRHSAMRERSKLRRASGTGRLFAIGDIHGCPDELGVMLNAIKPVRGDTVVFVGVAPTLDSCGVGERKLPEACSHIPDPHLEFVKRLATSYLRPPYLFVHAGVVPALELEEQRVEDMLWIRQEFIFSPHRLGATVVFGHTPMRAVMIDLPYKLGIDTGLVYGGKLTCIELTEGVLYQVGRNSRQAKTSSIALS